MGFVDWDFAAPCPPIWDLAFVAFSWVPLHARDVVAAEGFTRFAERPRRLRLLLDAYGYTGTIHAVVTAVRSRIGDHARSLRELAAAGDPLFTRLVQDGVIDGLDRAMIELADAGLPANVSRFAVTGDRLRAGGAQVALARLTPREPLAASEHWQRGTWRRCGGSWLNRTVSDSDR